MKYLLVVKGSTRDVDRELEKREIPWTECSINDSWEETTLVYVVPDNLINLPSLLVDKFNAWMNEDRLPNIKGNHEDMVSREFANGSLLFWNEVI